MYSWRGWSWCTAGGGRGGAGVQLEREGVELVYR